MLRFTVLTALALVWFMMGCGKPIYDCSDHAIQLVTHAKFVTSITLSGPGCEHAVITSDMPLPAAEQSTQCGDGFAPYCEYYYIDPHAAGDCNVHIGFDDGTSFEKTATFVFSPDEHCGGYYPHGSDSWNLGDLTGDAGSD
jgi:hypothetical protein